MDNQESTCDVKAGQMTVKCNDDTDNTVKMTAAIKKTEVHAKPSAEFTDAGEYWQAVYTADQLDKSFEDDLTFVGQPTADYLVLAKTVDLPCKPMKVDGVDVCQAVGSGLTWTCRYSLADQVKTDSYTVTGQDTAATAEGTGTLDYTITVEDNKKIGETVKFTISPVNDNLVYATVKSCDVKRAGDALTIIGHGQEHCTNPVVNAKAETSLFTSKSDIEGTWTAFKWSTTKANNVESQSLSCTIGLSETASTDAVQDCVLSNAGR